ncbi:MAG: alpha/beta hydrolase [Myxococcota bacterium]
MVRTALLAALLAGCAARHPACFDGGPPPAWRVTAADGTCLQGYRWSPDGPPRASVVLVHGIRDHALRYEPLATELTAAGFAVVAQDHRGHGRSGGPRQSFDAIATLEDDVALAVDQARAAAPDRPVFLFGHSMGGLVATTYVLDHPDEIAALALTGPALQLPDDVKPVEIRAARLLSRLTPGLHVQDIDDTAFVREPAAKAELAADPLIDHGKLPARSAGALVRGIDAVQARMAEVRLPVLALHGSEDPATNPAGSRALIARAASTDKTLHIVEGAAHDLLHEPEQAAVRAELVGWFAAHAP